MSGMRSARDGVRALRTDLAVACFADGACAAAGVGPIIANRDHTLAHRFMILASLVLLSLLVVRSVSLTELIGMRGGSVA